MPDEPDSAREARIRKEFPLYPLPAYLGMKIDKLSYGESKLIMKCRDELTQGTGLIHGGVLAALCDTGVAMALATMIDDNEKMLTIELNVNFVAPADGNVHCLAKIVHKGERTAVGDVEVRKTDCTLVVKGLVTYYLVRSQSSS